MEGKWSEIGIVRPMHCSLITPRVVAMPSAPNPLVDQCATAKRDFGVYFPEYAKVHLPFIYIFWYFRETRTKSRFWVLPVPSIEKLRN